MILDTSEIMSREIKFRAWHKIESVMEEVVSIDFDLHYVRFHPDYNDRWRMKDVELMQYTGLKDKHGKEIYEGDILSNGYGKGQVVFKRVYNSPCFTGFILATIYNKELIYAFLDDNYEVIGNRYENPELLGDE